MLRFFDLANGLTLVSLLAAVACALLAIQGRMPYALVGLILAGLCDLFDGWVARRLKRTEVQRRFGAQLDSVVDACAFGFAPVILLYCSGLTTPGEMLLLGFFAVCAVWRLAYFDAVTVADGPKGYHEGLPTTYVALVLPMVFLFGLLGPGWLRPSLIVATLGLALAMVVTLRIPKPRGLAYIVFLVAGLTTMAILLWRGAAHDAAR